MNKNKYKFFYFFLDIFLLFVLVLSIINNLAKPNIRDTELRNSISSINNVKLHSEPTEASLQIEYILDRMNIGDFIDVKFKDGINNESYRVQLDSYYDPIFSIAFIFTVLVFAFAGIFVIKRKFENFESRVFHNIAFGVAFLIGLTWGKINYFSGIPLLGSTGIWIDVFLRALYDYSHLWVGVGLLHFCLIFPKESNYYINKLFIPLYGLIISFAVIITYYHYPAIIEHNLELFEFTHHTLRKSIIYIPFIILVSLSLIVLLISYKTNRESYYRQRIRWIIFGIFISTASYVVLWRIPKDFVGFPLIPEWFLLVILSTAPILFMISILQHRIYDINLLLNRSWFYSISIIISLFFYFSLHYLLTQDPVLEITGLTADSIILRILIILIVILFYAFIKNKVQEFIDRRFFSEIYFQKQINKQYLNQLAECYSVMDITNLTYETLSETLKTEKLGIIILDIDNRTIIRSRTSEYLGIHQDFCNSVCTELIEKRFRVIAIPETIESGYKEHDLQELGFDLPDIKVLVISRCHEEKIGIVVLMGDKLNRFKYSHEDIDNISLKTDKAADSIHHIMIMNRIAIKEEENTKLKELNDIKSLFISSITHELKTPLTSIKIFAELMQDNQELSDSKQKEYLQIIQSECDRLNNLINNVLDLSKMEKGIKQYKFEKLNLNDVVQSVLVLMEFQIKQNGFEIIKELPQTAIFINGDKEAITEVLVNLISNSLKYSENDKMIMIRLRTTDNKAVLEIEDRGIGISEAALERIFEPFYRAETKSYYPGVGIGLSIVNNIISDHKGKIEVKSQEGIGTNFIIKLNLDKGYEQNSNN